MATSQRYVKSLIIITAFICSSALAFAGGEQTLLSTVPNIVKQAAISAVKDLTLVKAEMEQDNDKTIYELKGNAGGKKYNVEVTADGRIINIEEEIDLDTEDITLTMVPKNVKQAAINAVKGILLTEVEMEKEEGHTVYEFKGITKASLFHWSKKYRIKISADGKIFKVEEEKDVEDEQD